MAWAALILGAAGVVMMTRGILMIVEGRRSGRSPTADAEQRMVAGVRVVAGVKTVNRGAILLVLALVLAVAL
jgi:hypothetical protein